jgi:hypothetical protein
MRSPYTPVLPLPPPPPPEALAQLYTSVGELVINWGFVEGSLINIIAIIYQIAGGKHVEAQIPVSLKRRIRFLKLCCRDIPALAPFADELRAILAKTKEVAVTRNVIHGTIVTFKPGTGLYVFAAAETSDTRKVHIARQVLITIGDLELAALETLELARRLTDLTYGLWEAFIPEHTIDDFVGPL